MLVYLGVFAAAGYGISKTGWFDRQRAAAWQTWGTVLAGAVVAWYTWETRELRRATLHQTELQLAPFVVVTAASDDRGTFVYENVGQGTALRVRIDDVEIEPTEPIHLRFPGVAILRPGETRKVPSVSTQRGVILADPSFYAAHLDLRYANQTLMLRLRYEDIEGRCYEGTQVSDPDGGLDISGPKRRRD